MTWLEERRRGARRRTHACRADPPRRELALHDAARDRLRGLRAPAPPPSRRSRGAILRSATRPAGSCSADSTLVIVRARPGASRRRASIFASLERRPPSIASWWSAISARSCGTDGRSPPRTPRSGPAARSCTCRRASTSSCRCTLAFELATEGARSSGALLVVGRGVVAADAARGARRGPCRATSTASSSSRVGADAARRLRAVQDRHHGLAALRPPPRRGRARRAAASGPRSALGAQLGQVAHGVAPRRPRLDRARSPARTSLDGASTSTSTPRRSTPRRTRPATSPSRARCADRVARGLARHHHACDEGAQRTDAFQENRNLLLSPHAHADSIPGLEIHANDVRCTHGATAGRVDRELLFFLMARGSRAREAER